MGSKNEFTEIVLRMKDELSGSRRHAEKANPVRFMEERLSARDAKTRYSRMSRGEIERLTPDQRKDMVGLLGTGAVIERLRG